MPEQELKLGEYQGKVRKTTCNSFGMGMKVSHQQENLLPYCACMTLTSVCAVSNFRNSAVPRSKGGCSIHSEYLCVDDCYIWRKVSSMLQIHVSSHEFLEYDSGAAPNAIHDLICSRHSGSSLFRTMLMSAGSKLKATKSAG